MSIALCLLTILTVVTAAPISVSAKEGDVVVVNGIEIGVKQKDGSVLLNVSKDAAANGRVINAALGDNKKRSIVIPARTFKIDRAIWIGSNKTVKAKGATIYQTVPESPIIIHACKKTDYKSLENVTINGGIWKSKNNEKATKPTSTFRFNHAGNITIKNASVDTNYVSHAIELVACKNVRIYNCKLLAKGKQKNDIYAEPLQIDIATKATAPTVASYGSKYVNGQVCKNITVKKYGLAKVSLAIFIITAIFLLIYNIADCAGTRPFIFILAKVCLSLLASYILSLLAINLLSYDDRR